MTSSLLLRLARLGLGLLAVLSVSWAIPAAQATPVSAATTGLAVQDRSHDNDNPDNQLYLDQQYLNNGTSSVAMSSITVKYWFTNDNPADPLVFACDYAQVNCSNITGTFTTLANPIAGQANTVLTLSFSAGAGSIAAGGSSGEFQGRVHHAAYSNFNTAAAYSFVSDPSFVMKNTQTVTLYVNGVLASGVEP
jgi:hypothetical protein